MKSDAEQRAAADLKLLACAFEKLPKPIQDAHLTPDDRIRIVEVSPALSPVELAVLGV